jgi:hypothetical protein
METYGARCIPSPSMETDVGRSILAATPDSNGSLGIAISEAVEVAAKNDDTKYALGSVLNHVLLHQTVIGQEAQRQLALAGETGVDVVVGCVGGGSNFGGLALPFVGEKIAGAEIEIIATEPAACPTLTRGPFAYDFGDTAQLTPLVPMHTLGHDFVPPGIHAGGLRYHGASPLVSQLVAAGQIEARAYAQNPCFEAAVTFARTEGTVETLTWAWELRAVNGRGLELRFRLPPSFGCSSIGTGKPIGQRLPSGLQRRWGLPHVPLSLASTFSTTSWLTGTMPGPMSWETSVIFNGLRWRSFFGLPGLGAIENRTRRSLPHGTARSRSAPGG